MVYGILGRWHSFRPQNAGDELDWGPDGTITIDEIEAFTGIIRRGTYQNLDQVSVPIQGVVTCIGAGMYNLVIEHLLVVNGKIRRYEGNIVAQSADPEVYIVVGSFRTPTSDRLSIQRGATVAALDGQEEGIWVATKP